MEPGKDKQTRLVGAPDVVKATCPVRGALGGNPLPRDSKGAVLRLHLVITTYAKPGKGAELAQAMADRCRAVQQELGCQQFEVFQSALDTDKLVVLELWDDQAALDVHAQLNATRPPNPALAALRADGTRPREDYTYNRTR